MDPQQRLLMETVYEAVEAAGLTIEGLKGSDTSVFVGAMSADYDALQLRDLDTMPTYLATGIARSLLSNRISYFFDWHGPSMTIDTACSSSLVAIHHAVRSLRSSESSIAVACGSNVILGPESYIMGSKLKMLSPDGLSRMWDEAANGYARGEGVAAIVLKPLSSAIADGDDIECLVRGTGINQDGATPGITMPSAAAQQALIESTYANAGLDLGLEQDRPQFFEAHGTGTPAGDPVEAEAISKAFFGHDMHGVSSSLFVGSIKTVLGHTEGTAGIAAVLKASLAIQHGQVPPNLHFEKLSPAVAPFCQSLQIPTVARAWPKVCGAPRRASVNSFGFGGSNCHVILEGYGARSFDCILTASLTHLFIPFVFSAKSERSLRANLVAFATHLKDHESSYDIRSLAYTLLQRRSHFAYRVAFASHSLEGLRTQILADLKEGDGRRFIRPRMGSRGAPKILGIFNGQGAQYSRMGASLVEQSPLASGIIDNLESYLHRLPDVDRPVWSLRSELLASSSRVHEAALSQPLCTAVQILLVDLLRLAQVEFCAVIGHSSGEIAAAYAAGFLTARDAIIIAYYRGLHSELATSPNGNIKGAMLAVGTSPEDAVQLCNDEQLLGRVTVAAFNSSSSITLSGDEDAVQELEDILGDENKFSRRLRVDKAYHSSHMMPCFGPYIESLRRAGIKARTPSSSTICQWYSSVYEGRLMDLSTGPTNEYWAENMVRPVLFNQALGAALSHHRALDAALEVGAHPSLKGPSSQVIYDVLEFNIPYHGCLTRDVDAVLAMSSCLGFLWSNLETDSADMAAYETLVSGKGAKSPSLVKGLPSYQWDHELTYWHESRRSQQIRLRTQPFHPLLGHKSPDSASHHLRWRIVLNPSEVGWLYGHRVQGQIVFPAAGYICTALEAAKFLAGSNEVRLIELWDVKIHQAITLKENGHGVEVLVELFHVTEDCPGALEAKFTYSAALGTRNSDLKLAAAAQVRVLFGTAASTSKMLPERGPTTPHLIDVQSKRLYEFMQGLGYNFAGPFCSLTSLKRKLDYSSCQSANINDEPQLLLHPAQVDAAFQSIMLAYSYPGDHRLETLHLPTGIDKIRVDPVLCASHRLRGEDLDLDATSNHLNHETPSSGFYGHANLFFPGCSNAALQVDGAKFIPLAGTAYKDLKVFYKLDWVLAVPDGGSAADGIPVTEQDSKLLWVLSRIASFFLRKFSELPADSSAWTEKPLCHYLNYALHMTNLLRRGEHMYARREWLSDTWEDVMNDVKQHRVSEKADVKLMLLVGKTMPRVFRQETTMIEHMRTSGLLDEYYAHGFGTRQSSQWLSQAMKQITDRHPHLRILEVGAGTGGATKNILSVISHSFHSFTFTDISSSFFEKAAETLAAYRERMIFKVFDAERDAAEQGFDRGKYDVIIASLVIHATTSLSNTLCNLRGLLKPGGYLVVAEGTNKGPLQSGDGFIFGALSGWWLGVDDGRTLSPFINVGQWDALLRRTGFSGIDTMAPVTFLETFGLVLFVSQAVDERISLLREPLRIDMSPMARTNISKLIVVGGVTEPINKLAGQVGTLFKEFADELYFFDTFEHVDHAVLDEASAVISLAELDMPVFKDLTPSTWQGFKSTFEASKALLYVTAGRLADEPLSNMPVGFGRVAGNEISELHVQFLDFATASSVDARQVAESLVRLYNYQQIDRDELLWVMEPELVIDARGRLFVPRINPMTAANNRYNSIYRSLSHKVDVGTSTVCLHQALDCCSLREYSRHEWHSDQDTREETIRLRTTFTVLSAVKTKVGHHFLVSGVDSNEQMYLALVPRLVSILDIPKESAIPCNVGNLGVAATDFLSIVAAHLVSLAFINPLLAGQRLILHNAPLLIAQAVEFQSSLKDILVFYTTDLCSGSPTPSSWIKIHPHAGRSELSRILPGNLACFVGLSQQGWSGTEETMLSIVSRHCRRDTASSIFSLDGFDAGSASIAILTKTLRKAIRFAQDTASYRSTWNETIRLQDLISGQRPKNPMAIIDWTCLAPLPVQVSRLDAKPIFKENKTYWLCGMSGALGISLCDWMIGRGVRHLVITTRNPRIEEFWVQNHRQNGVAVEIMPCDVTDEEALRVVHEKIVRTMPPIMGVLNGAMVLRDTSIANMQHDQVMDVIRPKVIGSMHLDRMFHKVNLDFFLLISSINCVIGNVGQANYAAANSYMCSLAANRRKRGLNAVALSGGAIIGAGYITRETERALDVTVGRMALMHLSEEDFHQMIVEAIESSNSTAEVITGLHNISLDSPNIPKWYSNPTFSNFLIHPTASNEGEIQLLSAVPIKDQLQACRTRRDLRLLVEQSFADQLRKILLAFDMSNEHILHKRGPQLGLDSLISVDIRSWLLKSFQVSIPVLSIMSNDTMMNLVQSILDAIPAQMVPQIPQDAGLVRTDSTNLVENGRLSLSPTIPEPIIDWETESTPPADLASMLPVSSSPPAKPPRVIVVTGATGLLGQHLVHHLLKDTSVDTIHCLAVRRLEARLQNNDLLADARVCYHQGDLSEPLLGLSNQEAAFIFDRADVVVHSGADTSHVKLYRDLRASNVGSTMALTRLCLPRRIPIHYISSAGVCIYYNKGTFPEVSVSGSGSLYPSADGSFGYACSKWTNERFLERVHEQYRLPLYIYRPSTIIREGIHITTTRGQLDWVNALLYYIRKIKAAPRVLDNRGSLDLITVDNCCAGDDYL
ncbi:hypothetical protein CDD81_712 [Ophiocordyceps australis]|uniref:Uncharacterized protein n=1 Tax=Ophiocordyceps australis TaxID=1399860 RepID=A0A2C5X8G1_9HYPO|nr:hypothetical protein CDD81_712 [Ophiocordyceps australis]